MLYLVEVPEARMDELDQAVRAINADANCPIAVGMDENRHLALLKDARGTYEFDLKELIEDPKDWDGPQRGNPDGGGRLPVGLHQLAVRGRQQAGPLRHPAGPPPRAPGARTRESAVTSTATKGRNNMAARGEENISLLAHLMRRANNQAPQRDPAAVETAPTPDGGFILTSVTPEGWTLMKIIPPQDHFQTMESPCGPYISTPGCREAPLEAVHEALRRFHLKDWGNVCREDQAVNDHNSRTRDGPVLAAYGGRGPIGKIWVHLGRHAQHPTAMLPEEY